MLLEMCGQEGLCKAGAVPLPSWSSVSPLPPAAVVAGVGMCSTSDTAAALCPSQPPAPSSTVHLFLQERIYFSRSWLLLQQPKRSGVCTTSRAQHRSTSPACICVCVLGCHWCEGLQLCAKPPLCVVWVFARANSTGMLLWEHLLFPNKGLLSSKQAGVAGVC